MPTKEEDPQTLVAVSNNLFTMASAYKFYSGCARLSELLLSMFVTYDISNGEFFVCHLVYLLFLILFLSSTHPRLLSSRSIGADFRPHIHKRDPRTVKSCPEYSLELSRTSELVLAYCGLGCRISLGMVWIRETSTFYTKIMFQVNVQFSMFDFELIALDCFHTSNRLFPFSL